MKNNHNYILYQKSYLCFIKKCVAVHTLILLKGPE